MHGGRGEGLDVRRRAELRAAAQGYVRGRVNVEVGASLLHGAVLPEQLLSAPDGKK